MQGGVLSGDLKAIAGESGTKEPNSPNWMGDLPRMERGQAGLSSSVTGWVCSARHRRAQLNTSWYWTLLRKGDQCRLGESPKGVHTYCLCLPDPGTASTRITASFGEFKTGPSAFAAPHQLSCVPRPQSSCESLQVPNIEGWIRSPVVPCT